MPGAPGIVERDEMPDEIAVPERRVPQRRRGHVELIVAGHRVKVQHAVVRVQRRGQAHAENTVHPVELYTVDAIVAVQRVRVEIRMVDSARSVLRT